MLLCISAGAKARFLEPSHIWVRKLGRYSGSVSYRWAFSGLIGRLDHLQWSQSPESESQSSSRRQQRMRTRTAETTGGVLRSWRRRWCRRRAVPCICGSSCAVVVAAVAAGAALIARHACVSTGGNAESRRAASRCVGKRLRLCA